MAVAMKENENDLKAKKLDCTQALFIQNIIMGYDAIYCVDNDNQDEKEHSNNSTSNSNDTKEDEKENGKDLSIKHATKKMTSKEINSTPFKLVWSFDEMNRFSKQIIKVMEKSLLSNDEKDKYDCLIFLITAYTTHGTSYAHIYDSYSKAMLYEKLYIPFENKNCTLSKKGIGLALIFDRYFHVDTVDEAKKLNNNQGVGVSHLWDLDGQFYHWHSHNFPLAVPKAAIKGGLAARSMKVAFDHINVNKRPGFVHELSLSYIISRMAEYCVRKRICANPVTQWSSLNEKNVHHYFIGKQKK